MGKTMLFNSEPNLIRILNWTVRHGNINKAGKVKNATPHVPKQDKKKISKGRAKKRSLYEKRFPQE